MKRLFEELLRIRLQEDKTRLIDKTSMSPEEKSIVKEFFKTHSNLESKIDWNKLKNLTFDDFQAIMDENKSSRSNKKLAIKEKLSKAFDGYNVKVWYEDKNIILVSPLDYETAKYMQSVYNRSSSWCVCTENRSHWNNYLNDETAFVLIYCQGKTTETSRKYMLEVTSNNYANLWDEFDENVESGKIGKLLHWIGDDFCGEENNQITESEPIGYFSYLSQDFDLKNLYRNALDEFVEVKDRNEEGKLEEAYEQVSGLIDLFEKSSGDKKGSWTYEDLVNELDDSIGNNRYVRNIALEDLRNKSLEVVEEKIKETGYASDFWRYQLVDIFLYNISNSFQSNSYSRYMDECENYIANANKEADEFISRIK